MLLTVATFALSLAGEAVLAKGHAALYVGRAAAVYVADAGSDGKEKGER